MFTTRTFELMEPKRTKYDTNPLDPEVARATEKVWGQAEDAPTGPVKGATTPVGPAAKSSARASVLSEAPTQRIDAPSLDSSYPSVFVPPTYAPAEVYRPGPQQRSLAAASPSSRNVAGIGLPEKWAVALPYAPLYIGVVASIIELILVPRSEVRVRGHAAQGLALQIAKVAIDLMFTALAAITGSNAGGTLFHLAAFIFLVVSMIRVSKGATHRIAPLSDPADWLNKHIEPRKPG
jgi:uncharacterized membrane protein